MIDTICYTCFVANQAGTSFLGLPGCKNSHLCVWVAVAFPGLFYVQSVIKQHHPDSLCGKKNIDVEDVCGNDHRK